MGDLSVRWLGRVPYARALALQEETVAARRAGEVGDTLLLLEHPPVVTLGRGARTENLLVGEDALRAGGIDVHRVARGGDVTWHGPGQLVGYPIIDLAARGKRDVVAFLRLLEAVLCEALQELGVPPRTLPGMTGVFADAPPRDPPRKLASIGVGVRGWVTWHGFALNVDLDVADFAIMVPCGLHQVRMTTVADELRGAAPPDLGARARRAVEGACQRAWS
jgi:lipoyl(octanoyl) transferase